MRKYRSALLDLRNGPYSLVELKFGSLSRRQFSVHPSRLLPQRPPPKQKTSAAKPKFQSEVNWFEQYGQDPSNRVPLELDDNDRAQERLEGEIKSLEKELMQLQPPGAPDDFSKTLQDMSSEERNMLLRLPMLRKKIMKDTLKGKIPRLGFNLAPDSVLEMEGISAKDKVYLRHFNNALLFALAGAQKGLASPDREAWKWYVLCRSNIPEFLSAISPGLWDHLWRIARVDAAAGHTSSLLELVEDMQTSSQSLTNSQAIDYVEALSVQDPVKALLSWSYLSPVVEKSYDDHVTFQKLGIRVTSMMGQAESAEKLLQGLLDLTAGKEARASLPVIAAWAEVGNDPMAWMGYTKMRSLLGKSMTMDDYDAVSMAFLRNGRTDIGLAVFRDMMITRDPTAAREIEGIQAKIPLAIRDIQHDAGDLALANGAALSALIVMPRGYENKYFYAKWIKKLIGMEEVDAAAAVITLMCQRGVKPDARYLNGVIGAWLRTGDGASIQKAEDAVRSMISQRLNLVRTRHAKRESYSLRRRIDPQGLVPITSSLGPLTPSATNETFSVMIKHYVDSNMPEKVEALREKLVESELMIDAFFMNHMLHALVRSQRATEVWPMYCEMTETRGIRPNMGTYACLWDTQIARIRDPGHNWSDFPSCRELYSFMVDFWRDNRRHEEVMSAHIYDQIIRCLLNTNDLAGAIVALYTGAELFEIYPTESTSRMTMLHLSRILPDESRSGRSKMRSTKVSQGLNRVKQLATTLEAGRKALLDALAVNRDDLPLEFLAREHLELLVGLLQFGLDRSNGSRETREAFNRILAVTAAEMNCAEIFLGDHLVRAGVL